MSSMNELIGSFPEDTSRKRYLNEISLLREQLKHKERIISELQLKVNRLVLEVSNITYGKRGKN